MADLRLLDGEEKQQEQSNDEDDEGRVLEERCCDWLCCTCCCKISRNGAAVISFFVAILNILTMALCIYLVNHSTVQGEKLNMVFIATINAIMLVSDYLLLNGSCMNLRHYVVSWIFLYGALLFLQNVVGCAAIIVAVVNHASAWYILLFIAMLLLDVLYIYSMIGVFSFCRTLGEYSQLP